MRGLIPAARAYLGAISFSHLNHIAWDFRTSCMFNTRQHIFYAQAGLMNKIF